MDELRGPQIQLILHVKEGIGFGFLKSPFVVSGSLNGYILETDPVVPCHAPAFDAELVWEADKRRFRSLRVQNVPVKVEVYTMGTQGKKDKVGYLLISLLGAQPCPANKFVDVKHSWHRLLGVKSEGKCCHPQLMLSLTIQDRNSTPTPRNELRIFHNNETCYPAMSVQNPPVAKNSLPSLEEYIALSKKLPQSAELYPKLNNEEGLIQIGSGKDVFILSFVIGTVENLDMLLPANETTNDMECCVTYSIFNHDITTDRVAVSSVPGGARALLNQRSSVRAGGCLADLARYFRDCTLVASVLTDRCRGMFSVDLHKLVPTEDLDHFLRDFCHHNTLTVQERCFIVPAERNENIASRRPYVDVELSLKYEDTGFVQPTILSARSASHLACGRSGLPPAPTLYTSGSCTQLEGAGVVGAAYTSTAGADAARYNTQSTDAILQTNEIADLIRKMYESFTINQEKILASRDRPLTCDMQVQCETTSCVKEIITEDDGKSEGVGDNEQSPQKPETKSDCTSGDKDQDVLNIALSKMDRDTFMRKFVEELEDWKEKQQELFKVQLKRKEDYHLDLLYKEWERKRSELEGKLGTGVSQCRRLATELAKATDDLRLRSYRNTTREKKLQEAKKSLEQQFSAKFQQLREASEAMEADMNQRLRAKDARIQELQLNVQTLERQVDVLKNNLKNNEKEAENRYSGLTKDQTASLIQELRCLEEKLDAAVQSKSFFKEQWGRAVRELHTSKLRARRDMLTQLQRDRRRLGDSGMETIEDHEDKQVDPVDIKKLKDDFYVDLLANTPGLNESHSIISTSGPDGMELYDEVINIPKNPLNEKINDLTAQRDKLVQEESPDEDKLKQLNQEIRSLLLNCGS